MEPLRGATLISLDHASSPQKKSHLSVRFLSAAEFVTQYADNLTRGGLFVRNAEDLQPLEEVTIDLQLPGFKWFRLNARVIHIITPEMATSSKVPVGAGLELVDPPQKFQEALLAYLARLGQRSEKIVLSMGCDCGPMLEEAGYWHKKVQIDDIPTELLEHPEGIRALVILATEYALVQQHFGEGPVTDLLAIYNRANRSSLLSELDSRLP